MGGVPGPNDGDSGNLGVAAGLTVVSDKEVGSWSPAARGERGVPYGGLLPPPVTFVVSRCGLRCGNGTGPSLWFVGTLGS